MSWFALYHSKASLARVFVFVSMSPSVAELQAATVDHVQAVKENIKQQETVPQTAEVADKVGSTRL